jgi:peptide/nickel transport system ATP-binding protein
LDVTVEAAVLDLVEELQRVFGTAIMYISHNLGVIARVSSQVGVMYAGEIVERAAVDAVYLQPHHPYTLGLMRCVPRPGMDKRRGLLQPILGRVPSPRELPPGCVFEPRCTYGGARDVCHSKRPTLRQVAPRHWVRCHLAEEIVQPAPSPPPASLRAPSVAHDVVGEPLLKVQRAKTYYRAPSKGLVNWKKQVVKAVDDVSFEVCRGNTLGIVGESGCGKSTLVKTLIGVEQPSEGEFEFMGLDISAPLSRRSLSVIQELQMVFQHPDSTLNPSFTVGAQVARPLRRFGTVPRDQVRTEAVRLLRLVKLGEHYYDRLPRQLSGGEKQRVGIARALAGRPELLLCDEPVSALDVSVQAAVLNLLMEIQRELGTTMVFIAHDLSAVRYICDDIAVMYLGQIAEIGPAEAIYAPPYHPYTEALLSAVPIADPRAAQKRIRLGGEVPSALNPPSGCRFHTRCPRRDLLRDGRQICVREVPPWHDAGDGHRVFCHFPLEELRRMDAVVTLREYLRP